ncbi:MAG: acyl carrier protein [Lachnospiraceae bacterium]|jgi:acyl carrier protein|nr:acyl carrier protein [Lachnospiraceae bacterium]
MERKDIQEKIFEIVTKCISAEDEEICFDDDLREHGMDSINCIMIIVEIEDLYQFEFADEDLILENFRTINKLVDYVIGKISILL